MSGILTKWSALPSEVLIWAIGPEDLRGLIAVAEAARALVYAEIELDVRARAEAGASLRAALAHLDAMQASGGAP